MSKFVRIIAAIFAALGMSFATAAIASADEPTTCRRVGPNVYCIQDNNADPGFKRESYYKTYTFGDRTYKIDTRNPDPGFKRDRPAKVNKNVKRSHVRKAAPKRNHRAVVRSHRSHRG